MKRFITIIIISYSCSVFAQTHISADSIETLFYQKYLLRNAECSDQKIEIHSQIAEYYKENSDLETASLIYNDIYPCLSDSMQKIRKLDIISFDIALGKYTWAQSELLEYVYFEKNQVVSGRANILLGITYLLENNNQLARKYLKNGLTKLEVNLNVIDSVLIVLDMKVKDLKSPKMASFLSAVLPGTGQLYSGNLEGAIGGFGINAGLAYLFSRSVQMKHYYNAGVILFWPWQRYYRGNLQSARESVQKHNETVANGYNLKILNLIRGCYSFQ